MKCRLEGCDEPNFGSEDIWMVGLCYEHCAEVAADPTASLWFEG